MRPPRGLRARLVAAMVATSALAVAVSFLTLVPPLDHRLERDRLNDLRHLARTARFAVRSLPGRELRPGSPGVRRLLVDLDRRVVGHVALFDERGESLAEPDDVADRPRERARDLALLRPLPRRGSVRAEVRDGEAVVVTGVQRPEGARLVLVLRKPLGDTRAAASVVRAALPLAAAAALLVALLLAPLAARGLLRRLRRLGDDARALGEDGLDHVVDVGPAGDEVAEVASALEAMRGRLVVEEERRRTFLATASHELRTPLATLQVNLELLREELAAAPGAGPQASARAETALRQTLRLVGLAGDLLDLDRLEGGADLAAEPVELVELAGLLAADHGAALAAAGRTLRVEGRPPVHAMADAGATLRILGALVDNARAYGAGAVRVAVARDGSRATVRVADDGPGLAADERERVFERFQRGEAGRATRGFGLGLALARGLAEAMDGELVALPAARGACFELRLPGWAAPARA